VRIVKVAVLGVQAVWLSVREVEGRVRKDDLDSKKLWRLYQRITGGGMLI
jgi:hypothetical protein